MGGGGGGGGGPDAKKCGRNCWLIGPDTYTKDWGGKGGGGGGVGGVGGGGPSDISLPGWQPWLYILGKAEYQSPTVDTYSVQERLYVLEYRSPPEGGKGGRGGQFLRKGDNIC